MKKYFCLLLIFSFQLYSQSKENLYIIFNSQENNKCEKSIVKKGTIKFTIKNEADSIVILTKQKCKTTFLKKPDVSKNLDRIDACELINLKLHGYLNKIENKNIFILIEKKRKYKVIEIDSISFYEKPQD